MDALHAAGAPKPADKPNIVFVLFDEEFVCLGTYLRNAGYDAAYSGKWHLGFNVKDTPTRKVIPKTKKKR